MNELLFDNPILVKHLRSRLRQPQLTYLLSIIFIICSFILWSGYAGDTFEMGIPFVMLIGLQACALHLVGSNQVASSIGQVNDSGILDFHRISPLKPSTMALGFLLGAPISEYLVALVALPFAMVAAILGKPGFTGFVTVTITLLTTTWLFHLMAILSGLLAARGKTRSANWMVSMFIIIASFGSMWVYFGVPIPGMLTAGPALIEAFGGLSWPSGTSVNPATFFGMPLPMYVQTLCYQIPLILFLSIAVVRRIRSAEAALYSKVTAIAFLATLSVLNLGSIVGRNQLHLQFVISGLLYLNGITTLFLIGAITPDQSAFLNALRRANKLRQSHPSQWTDGASNRIAVIVLCCVTMAMVQAAVMVQSMPSIQSFVTIGGLDEQQASYLIPSTTTLTTIAYVGFAAQYFQIRLGPKAKGTLFVLLFCLWVVPLMAGAVFSLGSEAVAGFAFALSPIFGIGDASPISPVVSSGLAILFFALLLREESLAWQRIKDAAKLEVLKFAEAI
jgi:hypothetical protein